LLLLGLVGPIGPDPYTPPVALICSDEPLLLNMVNFPFWSNIKFELLVAGKGTYPKLVCGDIIPGIYNK